MFMMLYKEVVTFESADEILKCDHIKMTATELYFLVVLFILRDTKCF